MDNGMLWSSELITVVVYVTGKTVWREEGKDHRPDGPMEIANGRLLWMHEGEYHRLNGPAWVDDKGLESWKHGGELHRLDGPAIVANNGGVNRGYITESIIALAVLQLLT